METSIKNKKIDINNVCVYIKKVNNIKISLFFQRIFDIIIGLFGMLLILPFSILIIFGNILCGDIGPIFYSQRRIGKNGKIFRIYKFRSMVIEADEKLEEYLNDYNLKEEYDKNKKLKDDPRVTKVGKVIRKFNIDEIPQFINVFKGDMTLIGPRPYMEKEKKDMGEFYNYIISCKPGITGLWQVTKKENKSFNARLQKDIEYIYNCNIKMKFKILRKTIKIFFKGD